MTLFCLFGSTSQAMKDVLKGRNTEHCLYVEVAYLLSPDYVGFQENFYTTGLPLHHITMNTEEYLSKNRK